jgi:hypothetical protein
VVDRRDGKERTTSDPKRIVALLFEESGDVAPVDFGRFGTRAGQIIAQAARPRRQLEQWRQAHMRGGARLTRAARAAAKPRKAY